MPATARVQATVVKLATSNSKDDSIILTAHNSTNPSNRNKSNNRTANTVGTLEKAKMLAKVVKPTTACRDTSSSSRNSQLEHQQQQQRQ
jgi:hypothetical protein